jgi:hypothetical protein
LQLTRKLLNQGFLLVKLKSSLRKLYDRHHALVDRYRRVSYCSISGTHRVNPHCSCKPGDKSWMRKGPGSINDKWNISVVICDRDIP